MKPELQRIEAALQAVAQEYALDLGAPAVQGDSPPVRLAADRAVVVDDPPWLALTHSALASNLLQDLHAQVQTWGATLTTVLQQIQAVYTEGPLVDGWLEAEPGSYRLCGVGQDGQTWSRLCPASQVPDISLAIVRYQRLQALLTQKHGLEGQLEQVTTALIELHSNWAERAAVGSD